MTILLPKSLTIHLVGDLCVRKTIKKRSNGRELSPTLHDRKASWELGKVKDLNMFMDCRVSCGSHGLKTATGHKVKTQMSNSGWNTSLREGAEITYWARIFLTEHSCNILWLQVSQTHVLSDALHNRTKPRPLSLSFWKTNRQIKSNQTSFF